MNRNEVTGNSSPRNRPGACLADVAQRAYSSPSPWSL